MKKAFLLLIAVMTLTGAVWFNVGASGDAIETTVYSGFFADADAGQQVSAEFQTADADLQDLPCATTANPGYVACQVPEQYAGQQLPIQLTKNNVMYVYVIDVPRK